MKERFIRAAVVGALLFAPPVNSGQERFSCLPPTDEIVAGTPAEGPPPDPTEIEISDVEKEMLYYSWGEFLQPEEPKYSPEAILMQASEYVKSQIEPVCGKGSIYETKVDELTRSARILQPFEYAARNLYQDEQKIQRLLSLFEVDQKEAIAALVKDYEFGVMPPFGTLAVISAVTSGGSYFEENGKIILNLAGVNGFDGEEEASSFLIHEIWHGLPPVRTWQDENGDWYKARGLSLQKWYEEYDSWLSAGPDPQFDFTGGKIDHAFVYAMDPTEEVLRPTPTPSPTPEGRAFGGGGSVTLTPYEALPFIETAFQVLGRDEVIRMYLESRPEDFNGLVVENCESFSEFLKEGQSCSN